MSDTVEIIKKSIQDKMLDNDLTQEELASLRNEINCLSPEAIIELRAFFDQEYKVIQQETRVKLDSLLKECQSSPEKQQSSEIFSQVFEGTKSEILSKEHIKSLKDYILGKFEKFNLSVAQKDNISTAVIDRLLSDKVFAGIFGDISGGISTAVKTMESGGVVGAFNTLTSSDKKPDTKDEMETKTKTSATGIEKRIVELLDNATKPLVELLEKKPAGIDGFLSNPLAIAQYDGTGNISPDIQKMNNAEQVEYIKNLNNRILEVDGKIVPLEALREQGMNLVAVAPDWLQDIFKWLLTLPFIGNLLASFLGYKDGAEAVGGIDEELRQRKSIVALREFRTINIDGTKYEGKYSGKIDILKGKDLSKINRKKLSDFFAFTKEKGIDATTPDFWINVFEKGEISTKDKEGKVVSFKLGKKIEAEDLEKDFEGLYEKLNGLQKTAKESDAKEEKASQERMQAEKDTKQKTELAAQKAEAERIQNEMLPYKNLADGRIINNLVLEKIKTLTVDDFITGKYKARVEDIWKKDENRDGIMKVLDTYAFLLSSNEQVKTYIGSLKGLTQKPLNFETISHQRHNILAAAGITGEFMKQQNEKVTMIAKAQNEAEREAEKQKCITERNNAIAKVIESATVFPIPLPAWDASDVARAKEFNIEYPAGKIDFDPSKEEICIGEKRFSLKVKPFTKAFLTINDAKITNIRVNGNAFELVGKSEKYGSGDPIKVEKSEMAELAVSLLNGKYDTHKFADRIAMAPINTVA